MLAFYVRRVYIPEQAKRWSILKAWLSKLCIQLHSIPASHAKSSELFTLLWPCKLQLVAKRTRGRGCCSSFGRISGLYCQQTACDLISARLEWERFEWHANSRGIECLVPATKYRAYREETDYLGTVAEALCASIVRSAKDLLTRSIRFFSAW